MANFHCYSSGWAEDGDTFKGKWHEMLERGVCSESWDSGKGRVREGEEGRVRNALLNIGRWEGFEQR